MHTLQLKLLHGLSNKTRYAILKALIDGEKNVTELVEAVGGTQSNLSQHLACLADCGLVHKRGEGKYFYYRISTPKIVELIELLERAVVDFDWDGETIECKSHME